MEPVGYAQYFLKAPAIYWVIYFPGMIFTYFDHKRLFGFELGFINIAPAIFLGAIIGYVTGIVIKEIKEAS